MILHRIVQPALSQVGYLVGCRSTGEALAIDPTCDTAPFLAAAAALDLRVTAVAETHVHADFISGARALARQVGAQLYLSGEGGDDWGYRYVLAKPSGPPNDSADRVTLVHDDDVIRLGEVTIRVVHTPGHTPEHISFLVADAMLTGDFLFVGDVGRPDLLERSVGVAGSANAAARALFHSLERLASFPNALTIWPGHTAGSLCGKSLGADPSSTLGAQRKLSWAFRALADGEDAFVRQALADQPAPPPYFARMKQLNRNDPPRAPWVTPVPLQRTPAQLADPTRYVVDVRDDDEWAAGHVAGAHHIPLVELFDRVAELPKQKEIVVYCQRGARSTIAGSFLSGARFPRVTNLAGGFAAWEGAGLPVVRGA